MNRTKPTLVHTLVCDDVRQELGGKFSLMGLFDSFSAATFPVVFPRFAVVNEWKGGKGEFVIRTRLVTPNRSQTLFESEAKISLLSETQRHRDIAVLLNTTFSSAGTYWLEMLLDGEQVGLVPLPVHQVTQKQVH